MIQQKAKGLNSRLEAIPYLEDGFLPCITAPMYSVVDDSNYQLFLDNKIQVCLPRRTSYLPQDFQESFVAISLGDFRTLFIDNKHVFIVANKKKKVCIDTANGNMPQLHETIREAKKIHGDGLIIMVGNVSSVEAFVELAKTGVDYIRVGIGGGSGCNTTNNTGVGQEDLGELIKKCSQIRSCILWPIYDKSLGILFDGDMNDRQSVSKVKIVADGISSYIKLCQQKYSFNDNGYAAIIKLLNSGADLVMIGGLFAQCVESAGDKRYTGTVSSGKEYPMNVNRMEVEKNGPFLAKVIENKIHDRLEVKISGMSAVEEQKKYKLFDLVSQAEDGPTQISADQWEYEIPAKAYQSIIKPSEGSTKWVPVRWTLEEWLQGSDKQDEYPYLNGFVNSLKSAMSYTGSRTLNEFKS